MNICKVAFSITLSLTHFLELPATYRPYSLIEVGDSWEQSVLNYGGLRHSQRFLLLTELSPKSLRFLMDLS